MNAVAIQYIWQAIQESERSDDLSFIDALTRLTHAAARLARCAESCVDHGDHDRAAADI